MSKCWVLTREINEYDQDGEYFTAVFKERPSAEVLNATIGYMNEATFNGHSSYGEYLRATGGGRVYREHTWYNLREVDLL